MALDVQSIRNRVKDSGLFVQVRDVLSLADALANPGSVLKTAYVVIPEEAAEPNRRDGGAHLQRILARVVVSFPLPAQQVGMDRSDEVEAMRTTLKNHLAGWQPTGAETALDYRTSKISRIAAGLVWVDLHFDCKYLFTAAA